MRTAFAFENPAGGSIFGENKSFGSKKSLFLFEQDALPPFRALAAGRFAAKRCGQAAEEEPRRRATTMKHPYIPQPIDVSRIELPAELAPLTEALARNVHEVWAATRIAQGWRFGPERNDARKEHPCLIPYEELPEEERTYDRQTALETLKLIGHLGFEIRKR